MALFLFLFLFFCHPSLTLSDLVAKFCEGRNSTSDPTFQTNLNHLLSSLSLSLTSTNSTFNNSTRGSFPNFVYGLFLCRGDVGPNDCHVCVRTAIENAPSLCPNRTQVTLFYDTCQLRYSDNSFFSSSGDIEPLPYPSGPTADDPDTFAMLVKELMTNLSKKAAYDSSGLRFAAGELVYSSANEVRLFGLAECTRDLSMDTCQNCLQEILGDYWNCCVNQSYGGLLGKSCNFRYDGVKFFNGKPTVMINWSDSASSSPAPALSPMIPSPSIPTTGKDHGNNGSNHSDNGKGLATAPAAVFIVFLAMFMYFWRKRTARTKTGITDLEEMLNVGSLLFDLSVLKVATDNFSESNKLGQGGFGSVYKGTLSDGQEIAVKRLAIGSTQGEDELKNELFLVAKLQHRNLVRLCGVCLEEGEKLIVYEYMPNRSLDNFLFDPIKSKELNWARRFNIIGGIARGLLYLHEESHLKVVHRDLKASNILLDADMNPKISDFGLARIFGGDETQGLTSRVVGTFGYMSPEYALHGHISTKVDVYSFGVLALEIVTGRKNSSFFDSQHIQGILSYVWEHWSDGKVLDIMDPSLLETNSRNEVMRCIHISLLCVQQNPAQRPPMSAVVMLHSPSVPLEAPLEPRLIPTRTSQANSDTSGKQKDSGSANEVSITDLYPR